MIETKTEGGRLVIALAGRVDSTNTPALDREIRAAMAAHPGLPLLLDAEKLAYISSAGLRLLLTLAKEMPGKLPLRNVSPDVYDILSMTGFTDILDVRRRLREVSVAGCPVIGRGAIGTVYRLDADTIVKVYSIPDCVPMIEREQGRAKQALIRGIPTAISYDVVRVDGQYGSIFEMVKAENCNDLIARHPERADDLIPLYVSLLKTVHAVTMPAGELPDARAIFAGYADGLSDVLPGAMIARVKELLAAMPENLHAVHGDIHMKNVMLSDAEPLLIDMETLSVGDPVFDLAGLFVTYVAFNEAEPENAMDFLGIDWQTCVALYGRILRLYLDGEDGAGLARAEDKIKLLGYVRFLNLVCTLGIGKPELRKARIRRAREQLEALLGRVDSLSL